jgi:hypothetical protein
MYRPLLLVAALLIVWIGYAKADTVTDPVTNVSYTMTSSYIPEAGTNTYDITLVVDASNFMGTGGATTAFLSAVAFESSPGFTLLSVPGGLSQWMSIPGDFCDSILFAPPTNNCFANSSSGTAGKTPGVLTFVLGIQVPTGQTLNPSSYIIAAYDSSVLSQPFDNLGLTSMPIIIQDTTPPSSGSGGSGGTPVPEPGVLSLLSIGLISVAALASRRLLIT